MTTLTSRSKLGIILLLLVCSVFCHTGFSADQDTMPTVDSQGTVSIPAFKMPHSSHASQASTEHLYKMLTAPAGPSLDEPIEVLRANNDKENTARYQMMLKIYPVDIKDSKISGVPVQWVTSKGLTEAGDSKQVLINLHGGAFLWGAGSGGLVESIPIAALSGIPVVSVDYRQGPEHKFPAASEDVFAVYQSLLKNYQAQHIGIYGCSAGGMLTAQATAYIISKNLPTPGAIGTFCGTGLEFGGDSSLLDPPFHGGTPVSNGGGTFKMLSLPYLDQITQPNPLVLPGQFPDMLSRFPPTLLLAGSRDFAASSLTLMHRKMAAAGVKSQLYLFDGLWHSFFSDAQLPESEEAYRIIASFFKQELGSR